MKRKYGALEACGKKVLNLIKNPFPLLHTYSTSSIPEIQIKLHCLRGAILHCSNPLWSNFVLSLQPCVLLAQSCQTLCNPKDCSPPGSSVHGLLQAGILVWDAIPFFRGSSQLRDGNQVSCIAGRFFTIRATGKVPLFPPKELRLWLPSSPITGQSLIRSTLGR